MAESFYSELWSVYLLVTSSTWMEVRKFRLNFYNCYQKLRT